MVTGSSPLSEALRARALKWARFAAWEAGAEASRARSLSADLAWLADAMELAKRLSPQEYLAVRLREKAARLPQLRRPPALALRHGR